MPRSERWVGRAGDWLWSLSAEYEPCEVLLLVVMVQAVRDVQMGNEFAEEAEWFLWGMGEEGEKAMRILLRG